MRNRLWTWIFAALIVLAAAQAAMPGARALEAAPAAPAAAAAPAVPAAAGPATYRLGSGDKLRIIVFGETELGGDYTVDGSGFVRMPLIGQVHAAGDTLHDFEAEVATMLRDGYLKDPRVSIEVTNYRPFYILGEVARPGEYPFVNGMSVLNAVAVAGGYSVRANQGQVFVRRDGSAREVAVKADQTTKIYPGDIIRVGERLF